MNSLYKNSIALLLSAGILSALTSVVRAQSVTAFGVDDFNTTSIDNFNPPAPVFQCDWIDQGLSDAGFTAANGWNITYAGAANASFLANDLSITQYTPWAVNQPGVVAPDGTFIPGTIVNQDAGGVNWGLQYTPQAGDPTDIHFVQAGDRIANGGADNVTLYNNGGATPWYDANGGPSGIGTLPGNGSWMVSNPFDQENEIEDYFSDVEFQTFIATDNVVSGVHNVTLYGGYWWGYNYSTVDVPEPGAYALFAGAATMAIVAVKRRKKQSQIQASA